MRREAITAALFFSLAGLLAGCVTKGSEEAVRSGAATTTAPDAADPTTPNQAVTSTTGPAVPTTSTTTTGGASQDHEDGKRLLAALPTPEEVGPGYEMTSDDGLPGGGNRSEEAEELEPFEEQCPGLASMTDLDIYDRAGTVRAHSYGPEGESTIGVELIAGLPPDLEATFEDVVADLQDCDTITIDDEPDGAQNIVMTIDVVADDTYGDFGVAARTTLHYDFMGAPFEFESQTQTFVVDGIQVTIVGRTSGNDDGSVDPVDADAVQRVAALMEQRAGDL